MTDFPTGTILGYPRIGRRRELKKAVEAFWAGRIDEAQLEATAAGLGKPFSGYTTETFWSAAPLACGPYAVRVRLVPVDPGAPSPDASADWAADVAARPRGVRTTSPSRTR